MLTTINTDGSAKVALIGSAVPSGAFYNGGLAYRPDGTLYVKRVVGAISGAFYNGGLATTPDGALYVADGTAASDVSIGGVRCRADGVARMSSGSIARWQGGIPTDDVGAVVVGPPLANLAAAFDASINITSSGGFASQWADLSGNARHLLQATGANQPIHLPVGTITSGTAAAGSTGTTLNLAASALAVNDVYNDMTVAITGGTGSGQSRTITDYVGATKIATVAAWSVTPDDTSTYAITATRASVFFDGAAHYMKATFTLNQPETVYLVVKQVSWTGTDVIMDGNGYASMLLEQRTASPRIDQYGGAYAGNVSDLTVGARGVICSVFNGASSSLQINLNTAATGNAGAANGGGFTLGSVGTAGNYSNIQVYEGLLYSAAPDAATRANIIRALMNKWGIA